MKAIIQYHHGTEIIVNEDTIFYANYDTELIYEYYGKPVLYFYPTEETEISVKLINSDRITTSYPKYPENGWRVLARPNGILTDLSTNRTLYCLYYESKAIRDNDVYKDGFIVEGENISKFLEEKLSILGLNEREAEEFIIYWLPKLEANKYNYIRFAEEKHINDNMALEINPKPDTLIRVIMEFKGLDEPIDVKEQILTPRQRRGYTVVEWGATEILH